MSDHTAARQLLVAAALEPEMRFAKGAPDLGQNSAFVPGSIRPVSGKVEEVTASAITFHLSGRPGEPVAFAFRASR